MHYAKRIHIKKKSSNFAPQKSKKNNKTDEYGSSIKTAGSAGNYL